MRAYALARDFVGKKRVFVGFIENRLKVYCALRCDVGRLRFNEYI